MKKKAASRTAASRKTAAPAPLLSAKKPVDWWFIFKFNSAEEPGNPKPPGTTGLFDVKGWKRPKYEKSGKKYSQHIAYASSADPALRHSNQILGTSQKDPLGTTFAQVYLADNPCYYVVWNDQFYSDPLKNGGSPWGHSKGLLAWNDAGEGFVLQVSTPSWPGAGNKRHPRNTDGNTLGFVKDDDIEVSQHFFALKLTKDDLTKVLAGLHNASVLTDPTNPQVVNNGGPPDVEVLVKSLGRRLKYSEGRCLNEELSSGVRLIAKPSRMAVPPWQLVSAQLGGVDLRVACWWANPKIYSTTRDTSGITCWDDSLGQPGAVEIATSGTWKPRRGHSFETLGLTGGLGANHNHAKFGVTTSGSQTYAIFGDMNQQGALCPAYLNKRQTCSSSQNGRGGLFYALDSLKLHGSLTQLLQGDSAPTDVPAE